MGGVLRGWGKASRAYMPVNETIERNAPLPGQGLVGMLRVFGHAAKSCSFHHLSPLHRW